MSGAGRRRGRVVGGGGGREGGRAPPSYDSLFPERREGAKLIITPTEEDLGRGGGSVVVTSGFEVSNGGDMVVVCPWCERVCPGRGGRLANHPFLKHSSEAHGAHPTPGLKCVRFAKGGGFRTAITPVRTPRGWAGFCLVSVEPPRKMAVSFLPNGLRGDLDPKRGFRCTISAMGDGPEIERRVTLVEDNPPFFFSFSGDGPAQVDLIGEGMEVRGAVRAADGDKKKRGG